MANFVFGQACGRVGEYVNRVLNNDPSTAALTLVPMSTSITAEAAETATTLALAITAGFVERTGASWGRKTADETGDGLTWTWDATNNRMEADLADTVCVWTAPATGLNTTGLVICYNPTGGADTTLIPLVHLDMAVTANDQQVTFQFNAEGWYNATRS